MTTMILMEYLMVKSSSPTKMSTIIHGNWLYDGLTVNSVVSHYHLTSDVLCILHSVTSTACFCHSQAFTISSLPPTLTPLPSYLSSLSGLKTRLHLRKLEVTTTVKIR